MASAPSFSLDHVFFPDSGVVSAVAVYADGGVVILYKDRRVVSRSAW
jgi:hypothetical protein